MPIWKPNQSQLADLNIVQFQEYINLKFNQKIQDYQQLHQFSIDYSDSFWQALVDFSEIDFIPPTAPNVKFGPHKIQSERFNRGTVN